MTFALITILWRYRLRASLFLLILSIIVYVVLHKRQKARAQLETYSSRSMEFLIDKQWDGQSVDHEDIILRFTFTDAGLQMNVDAPFFNDPPNPGTKPGEPLYGLWNYEVVEAFFLNDKNQYLEVELCPHGQHIVLMLSDYRKVFQQLLPLKYESKIEGAHWKGEAVIPWEYFPPAVTRFNAYAIHGTDPRRVYEALYPVPHGKFAEPDFHRLEFFGDFKFPEMWQKLKDDKAATLGSSFWTGNI